MRQMNFLLMVVLLCGWRLAIAQFTDTFADGDFHRMPSWSGDDTRFVVSGERLRLQAPAQSGIACLATASAAVHEAVWSFNVQLDFTPSSTNYAKVYLVSDTPGLGGSLNGYFVRIGNTTREVSLYRQTGTTEVEIVDGLDDRVNQSSVNISVRVTRNAVGRWGLFTDVGRLGAFQPEGEADDAIHTVSAWFGVQCVYTSTRSDKFWFDDFVVSGTRVPDTTPPAVVTTVTSNPKSVRIEFSEPVIPEALAERFLLEGVGHPVLARISMDSLLVELEFPKMMVNGLAYTLTITGVSDRSGNRLVASLSVMYFRPGIPKAKSVMITEILPDPSPQVGLPASEYIELYNRSDEPYDLGHWVLTDGSSTAELDGVILRPQEYLVVTNVASATFFDQATVTGVANFPSLNNSGDRLKLIDGRGVTIDSVSYSLSWFRDEDKQEGGWSLELIDLANPCGEGGNWTASEDPKGGTPGRANSVSANKPDLTPPRLQGIWPRDSLHILLSFDELLQYPGEASVEFSPPLTLKEIVLEGTARREIEIQLSEWLRPRTTYTMKISGIRDCMGNGMDLVEVEFGMPEPADSGDVVISEILFNPRPGGVDFVELHNLTGKFIQLENWSLGNGSSATYLPKFLLHPGQWVALSEDPYLLATQYVSSIAKQMVQAELPSLPDDEGKVVLQSSTAQYMDQVDYHDDWHSVFLKDNQGVSLERIDNFRSARFPENWISASARSGYGTPGSVNSQQRSPMDKINNVEVVPEIFTRGSVSSDFVQIHYRFDFAGGVANVRILNHGGSPIKSLAENEWLGAEGFFRWDGDRTDGQKAPAGYYFVWFEWFDATGRVETYRKRVIVSAR